MFINFLMLYVITFFFQQTRIIRRQTNNFYNFSAYSIYHYMHPFLKLII